MPLSSSGACLSRGMHDGWERGAKQARASSKALKTHRTGWGLQSVPVDGAFISTKSHSTDARRYKVAMSESLETRRFSRESSRANPNAETSDVVWDKSGRNGPRCSEDRLRNESRQSAIPIA